MSTDDEISTIHAPDVNEADLRLSANYAESSVSDSDNEKYKIGRTRSILFFVLSHIHGIRWPITANQVYIRRGGGGSLKVCTSLIYKDRYANPYAKHSLSIEIP